MKDINPVKVWKDALADLEHQMTKATFNQWLQFTKVLDCDGKHFRIEVKNDYARDWLHNRLKTTVERTLSGLVGYTVTVSFVVQVEKPRQLSIFDIQPPAPTANGNGQAPTPHTDFSFAGFDTPKANFVQIPHELIDDILPYVLPSVSVLVLAVLRRTIGVVVDGYGNRKKEWPTTYNQISLVTGLKSQNSVWTALWEARAMGLIIQREIDNETERKNLCKHEEIVLRVGQKLLCLRPRLRNEPIDYPNTPKPNNQASKKGIKF